MAGKVVPAIQPSLAAIIGGRAIPLL